MIKFEQEMKIKSLVIISSLLLLAAGCTFDDPVTEYPVKSVLFTYQTYNRQLVVGEGLTFKIGVVFAGLDRSDRDRVVKYKIDPTLLEGTSYKLLPSDYYTCADPSQLVIKKGELKAYMPVVMDSAKFVNDPLSLTGEYVLPVRIVEADADTITHGKDYTLISLSYQARQYGNYNYKGARINGSTSARETYRNAPEQTNSIRQLQTLGPQKFRVYADQTTGCDPMKALYSMVITVPVSGGGTVTLEPDSSYLPAIPVSAVGTSTYDVATKTFILNYKYTSGGVEWTAADTLTFRNRIRDDQGDGRILYEWRGF